MDSSSNNNPLSRQELETEILTRASNTPFTFDPEKADSQIELVLKMLLQVNSQYQ